MAARLEDYQRKMEELAVANGLDYYPVDFQQVPSSFMMEIAVYGLPIRMPHWSFGLRYIYQLVQHRMGNSRLFEVVFPGDPGRAYLDRKNSVQENTLVTAHVLGHADFSKNNLLFRRSRDAVGSKIVDKAAEHARQIGAAIDAHGQEAVEHILDAALALEQHIAPHMGIHRDHYPEYLDTDEVREKDEFFKRFESLPGMDANVEDEDARHRAPIPPQPEKDLLWFIAHYAPELEDWERDIFLAVREESFYFQPVFATQIMNEGWASYWHARLLREAEFLPHDEYVDAIKTHSDVVRPYGGDDRVALQVNPYHLGFVLWEHIVENESLDLARTYMEQDDDFSFIRNHLDEDLARELKLFQYSASDNGEIKITSTDIDAVRESILAPKFNFGAPAVMARHIHPDGTLELLHDHTVDGRGLDVKRAKKVLDYIRRVWRRPVMVKTIDHKGEEKELKRD